MQKKTKVFVAIPSVGTVSDLHPYVFRDFERDYKDSIELVYSKQLVNRKFHDFARNALVEEFLATDCDILWFLDSDVVPPPTVLDIITQYGHQWELAGAPYGVFITPKGFKGPQVVMCVYKQGHEGLHAAKVPTTGVEFVDGMATGCIFIKREVLTKLQKPYFEFKFDAESKEMTEGEDLGFCRKVNELGYKFFVDYSKACKHYKTLCVLEVNNYANDYAQIALNSYTAEVKKAIEQAYKRGLTDGAKKGQTASGLYIPKKF